MLGFDLVKPSRWLLPIFVLAPAGSLVALFLYYGAQHRLGRSGGPVPLFSCASAAGIVAGIGVYTMRAGRNRALAAIVAGSFVGVIALFVLQAALWLAYGTM